MSRRTRLEIELDGDPAGAISAARRTERAYGGLGRELDGVDRRGRGASAGMAGLAGGLGRAAGAAGLAAGGLGLAAGGAYKLVQAASDAGEAASAAATIYGKAFPQIEAAASKAARTVGLSKTEYLDAAKTVGVFGQAAGLQGKELAGFSQELITAAGDLASFNNTSVTDALDALGSGLRGEAEPLRRFGILLDDASLRNQALKMGLISTTKDALTPQQKTLASQALIMGGLGAAQGDFSRTSGGLANQQRILTAQLKDTAAQLGEKLLPYALKAATWANDMVPKVVKLAGELGDRLGPILTTVAGFLGGLRGSFDSTGKATSRAGQVVELVTGHFRSQATQLRNFFRPALDGARSMIDRVRAALDANPRAAAAARSAFSALMGVVRTVRTVLEGAARVAGTVVGGAMRTMGSAIGGAIGFVDRLIGAWQRARDIVSSAASAIRGAASSVGGFLGFSAGGYGMALAGGPRLATASLATAALTPLSLIPALAGAAGAGSLTIDRRTFVNVDGALDPVAVADQLRGILADAERRDGRRP